LAEAVRVRGLVQVLGRREVLRGVTLELAPGKVLAVMGPNGAGKTTLLKVVATLLVPTRGEVRVDGLDVRRQAAAVRGRVGFLGHQPFLYPQLTGWENLYFWAQLHGVKDPARRLAALLDLTGLSLFAHDPVRSYSRGMQQRLGLARALLHQPPVLLLDEPYTGLDAEAGEMLDRVIGEWRQRRRTVIFTTHDAGRSQTLADEVLWLDRGRPRTPHAGSRLPAEEAGDL